MSPRVNYYLWQFHQHLLELFSSSAKTKNFLFSFHSFFAALLPSTFLVLEQRPQIPDDVGNLPSTSSTGTWLLPLILRALASIRHKRLMPSGSRLPSSRRPLRIVSLSCPSSEVQASLSPSILISKVKETATTTKIPSYSDLKQTNGKTHFRCRHSFTQSPNNHFSFQVPHSFRHAVPTLHVLTSRSKTLEYSSSSRAE